MTRDEIVTALRCCAFNGEDSCEHCTECPAAGDDCESELQFAAADLIENQQREIEALRQANEGLRQANEGLRFNLAALSTPEGKR
jgi:nitric oxide reductase activation protein